MSALSNLERLLESLALVCYNNYASLVTSEAHEAPPSLVFPKKEHPNLYCLYSGCERGRTSLGE